MLDIGQQRHNSDQQRDNYKDTNIVVIANRKLTFEGEFSKNLANEFKAPLGSMLGMLDLLLTTDMSLRQKEYLEAACSSGRSTMDLTDAVLTFSEIQAGEIQVAEQDCHLIEILDEVVTLMAEKALKKSINLGYVLAKDFPSVVVTDSEKLQKTLIQLLDNAIKFTHFGEVSIYVEQCEPKDCLSELTQTIRFTLKDNGIGIANNHFQQVFEPFFQVDSSPEKNYQGLGLGLAIARKLVQLMQGELTLSSSMGLGSQFIIKLPIKKVVSKIGSYQKENLLLDQKFLLVTDSALIKDSVKNSIQSMGGAVSISESGQDALTSFSQPESTIFNAIIVDEDMVDIPLVDFFGLLQDTPNFSDTFPVILSNPYFSSYSLDELEITQLEKPILSSTLTQVLVKPPPALSEIKQPMALANLDFKRKINVLVAEDSRINQQVIEAMLNRLNCNHQVTPNGKLAVEKVVYGDFDLVLMDCNMPVLSGYAATRQIRDFEEQDAGMLPIIGMATNNTEANRQLCMKSGMSGFICKPLNLVLLRDLLTKWTAFTFEKENSSLGKMDSTQYQLTKYKPANNLSYNRQALERLAFIVGGSIRSVIQDFCVDMSIYVKTLRSAVNQKNESEISYISHTLKGAARNFGADQIVRLSTQLEEKARRSELDDMQKVLLKIEISADILSAELKKEIESICELQPVSSHFESKDLVLVVDDDRTSRVLLAETLRNSGCEVDEAKDGIEALEICRRCMPDLILMDAIMPGLDGFDLCHTIRNMPYGTDIPILIITASDSEDAVSMAFSVAATDFINKPVNTTVIQNRVHHLIASKKAERYMKQLAYHDSLTGLPNRTNLMQHLQLIINQSKVENSMFAVLFLDLDHFKMVNDTMGHDVGDLLLKAVSRRLRNYLRGQDFIARLGGDEFTIVLQNIRNLKVVEEIAEKLRESIKDPFVFLRRKIMVTTSIGASVFPVDGEEISDLLKHADSAMFRAKNLRDQFCFYKSGMEAEVSERFELQRDLRLAVEKNELKLLYQPKMDLKSSLVLGAEALLRWNHSSKGQLTPSEFIEVAEACDLMPIINSWVIQEGIKQLVAWLKNGHRLKLSFNVSLSGSTLDSLYETISSIMTLYPTVKGFVELEITENALMCQPELICKELLKIRELGVSIALDDFGRGYSSLNHLKDLPVDVLKIDRLFISGLANNHNDKAIVKNIINLARELNIETVAEGVETIAQKTILAKLNCHYFQGFLISGPLSNDLFAKQFLKPTLVKKK